MSSISCPVRHPLPSVLLVVWLYLIRLMSLSVRCKISQSAQCLNGPLSMAGCRKEHGLAHTYSWCWSMICTQCSIPSGRIWCNNLWSCYWPINQSDAMAACQIVNCSNQNLMNIITKKTKEMLLGTIQLSPLPLITMRVFFIFYFYFYFCIFAVL